MECVSSKETINEIVGVVNDVSYSEKKDSHLSNDDINKFLDDISLLRNILDQKVEAIDNINQLLQKISWLKDLDDDCLKLLNMLIIVGKDFHNNLTKGFSTLDKIAEKGIAVKEIFEYKECVEDLSDILNDLDMVFFIFPKDENFVKITNMLSIL